MRKIVFVLAVLLSVAMPALAGSGRTVWYADVSCNTTVQQLVAQNPGRLTVCCQNSGATNPVNVGNMASVGSATGALLDPDTKGSNGVCLATTDAIGCYSAVGTTVRCFEVYAQ